MSGQTKLAIGGAATVAVVITVAYLQRQGFAEQAAAGDFTSAERAANISFLMRDAAVPVALAVGVILILLLAMRSEEGPSPVGP
jgi:hypothetical protein